jgi:hypothetical protein
MNKHTPGTWMTIPANGFTYVCQDTDSEGGVIIAESIKEADASLIAAAPEMLEALKECAALLHNIGNLGDAIPWLDSAKRHECIRAAMAANTAITTAEKECR